MKIKVEIDQKKIKELIAEYVNSKLGELTVEAGNISILVKSKQNFRSTWEECDIIATNAVEKYIPEIKAEVAR
jgi:hypothetical protein